MNKLSQIIGIFIVLITFCGARYLYNKYSKKEAVMCTLEAMQCPDGSYVGRSGPRCEFSPCPTTSFYDGWKSVSNGEISFQYPENFGTKYISPVDWPPHASLNPEPFSCLNAGTETERAGRTESKIINGISYCVTTLQEGAAGTIYIQHAYAKPLADKTIIFTFSIKETQCANYPNEEQKECENERALFSIDQVMDKIMGSLQIQK